MAMRTFVLECHGRLFGILEERIGAGSLLDAFYDLLNDAEGYEPPLPVELTTALNDDCGERSRGSMISHTRHVIYVLTQVDGRQRSWEEVICSLAHELGHAKDGPPSAGDDRLVRESRAWDHARERLSGLACWEEVQEVFEATSAGALAEYKRVLGGTD